MNNQRVVGRGVCEGINNIFEKKIKIWCQNLSF